MLAVANKNTLWGGMLETFTNGFKKAGVSNHLILALDDETKKWCAGEAGGRGEGGRGKGGRRA